MRRSGWLVAALLLVLGVLAWRGLGLRLDNLHRGITNLPIFAREAFPPNFSIFQVGLDGLWDTILIAYLATLFGLLLSLPLAILAARNLTPVLVSVPIRVLLAAIRVMPSILWAILFVIIVGLGPLAGVLAMTFYTLGFLGKLQYEAIEGLPAVSLEAAGAMGIPRWQRVRHVVLPESANALLSQTLFMFEYNVRASTIIGIVGAGGIGFYLNQYLRIQQYDSVLMLLLMVFAAVVIIDALSGLVRRRFTEEIPARRASWRDVFTLRPPRSGV